MGRIVPEIAAYVEEQILSGKSANSTARELWNDHQDKINNKTFESFARYVRQLAHRIKQDKGIVAPPTQKKIEEMVYGDLNIKKSKAKEVEAQGKYKTLLREYEVLEKRFDTLLNIKEAVEDVTIEAKLSNSKHEAVPIIQLSDWHFEERVDADTINFLNEYNLEIAQKRWHCCIQNSMKLVQKERASSEINQIVIWLGGDFITGYIHEELEESNYLSPTEATRFAKKQIISALEFYVKHGKFEKIVVICNYGNHGRTNKKPRVSTSYKNSYEWMMYHDIADYFKRNTKMEFIIPNGIFAYADVLGVTCRFWHGDTIGYGGGIGGLTIPLIKAIHRYNQQRDAQYNFMGHFHQLWQATRDCQVNGSGVGYGAYAQRIGAPPEPPQQGFTLIDKKYGVTTKLPIKCE